MHHNQDKGMTRWARVASILALALLVVSTSTQAQVPPPPPGAPGAPPPFVPPPNMPPQPAPEPVRPDPLALLDSLSGKVAGLPGNKGVRQSLQSKLKDARACLIGGDKQGAMESLEDFASHTQAQAGKHIATGTATSLLQDVRELEDRLSEA